MAISPLFTATQVLGSPSEVVITDTSTGSDTESITKRRVYFTDKNGDAVNVSGTTTAYEQFNDYPSTTAITLDLLTQDLAADIRCDWLNASNVVKQTLTIRRDFTLYAKTYYISLIKSLQSNQKLKDSANFWKKVTELLDDIEMADDAILLLNDIYSSQAALNRAKELIDSPSYFF